MTQHEATAIRRDAVVKLEHAIARIGYYSDGWPTANHDAIHLLQHAKWGIEAMDYPVSNRFWDEQRREYMAMLGKLGAI